MEDLAQARPVRPPPACRQAQQAQRRGGADRQHIGGQRDERGDAAGERRSHQPQRRRAPVPEHHRVIAGGIDADRQRGDQGGEHRAAHGADEIAQHIARQHRYHRPAQYHQEPSGAHREVAGLAQHQQNRAALPADSHAEPGAGQGQPQGHAQGAANGALGFAFIAVGGVRAAQLGGNDRRQRPGQRRQRPYLQPEDRDRQTGAGQRLLPQPSHKNHVDRIDRHLQHICQCHRRRQHQRRAEFGAKGAGRRGHAMARIGGADAKGKRIRRSAPDHGAG